MEALLTIGTVVRIKSQPSEIVIVGYYPRSEESKGIYTYLGINASFGISFHDDFVMFMDSQVEEVLFEGYSNEKSKRFTRNAAAIIRENA